MAAIFVDVLLRRKSLLIRDIGELIRGRELFITDEMSSVYEACRTLRDRRIGALAVLRDGVLVGILSERDVITRVVSRERDPAETTVREVMTADPQTVDITSGLTDALAKMLDGHFRHLPVVQDGIVIGMISMRDIPTEYRQMYERYQRAVVTPAAEAEAGIDQHQRSPTAGDPKPPSVGLHGVGWSFASPDVP